MSDPYAILKVERKEEDMTHKAYRKEVLEDRVVLHPVYRDSGRVYWDVFTGYDAGFVCWCGDIISSFDAAYGLAFTE